MNIDELSKRFNAVVNEALHLRSQADSMALLLLNLRGRHDSSCHRMTPEQYAQT